MLRSEFTLRNENTGYTMLLSVEFSEAYDEERNATLLTPQRLCILQTRYSAQNADIIGVLRCGERELRFNGTDLTLSRNTEAVLPLSGEGVWIAHDEEGRADMTLSLEKLDARYAGFLVYFGGYGYYPTASSAVLPLTVRETAGCYVGALKARLMLFDGTQWLRLKPMLYADGAWRRCI